MHAPAPNASASPHVPRGGRHAASGAMFSRRIQPSFGRIWQLDEGARARMHHALISSREVLSDLLVLSPPRPRLLDRLTALLAVTDDPRRTKCDRPAWIRSNSTRQTHSSGKRLQISAQLSGSEIIDVRCVVAAMPRLSICSATRANYYRICSISISPASMLRDQLRDLGQCRFIARSISR